MIALALAALLQSSAPPAPPAPPSPPAEPWTASGSEEGWVLTVGGGRMVLTARGFNPLSVPVGKPVFGESGWTYKGAGVEVDVLAIPCDVKKGGERTAFSVTVQAGRRFYGGCGGARLSSEDLSGTSWEIVEIAGGRVGGANYTIDFVADQFLAYDGCHRVGGSYVQSPRTLTIKIEGGTANGCGPVSGPCAAAFWRILAEPVDFTRTDADHIVLAGKGGVIRLRKPDEAHLFDPPKPTPCAVPAG